MKVTKFFYLVLYNLYILFFSMYPLIYFKNTNDESQWISNIS